MHLYLCSVYILRHKLLTITLCNTEG
uniref:Uncharacterized protein n=1 Tax=Anguilla anguilla TaxID=7936 RepID=A0A0E9SGN6_ANGAN